MYLKLDVVTALRSPQLLYGLGLIPEADRMLLTVRDAEGKERSLTVIGEPKGPSGGREPARRDSGTAPDLDAAARRDLLV